jgi:hypothetical protein
MVLGATRETGRSAAAGHREEDPAGHDPEPANDGKRETSLKGALAIQEETLGPEHPRVAMTLTQLMFLYRRQGKESAAAAAAARATMILAHHARQSASL